MYDRYPNKESDKESYWPNAFTIVGIGLCVVLLTGTVSTCVANQTKAHMDYRIACVQAGKSHTENGCVESDNNVLTKMKELLKE